MKSIALSALLVLAPVSVLAQTFDCTATNVGRGGWIPPRIIVQIDRAGTSATAFDGYIKEVHDKPIPVELSRKGAQKVQLKWKLRNVKIKNAGSGILSHSMVLETDTGKYRMNGRLHGYDNSISGSGVCKRK